MIRLFVLGSLQRKGTRMLSVGSLLSTGLVNVDYPSEPRRVIEKAVESWRKFCELPEAVKKNFEYKDEGNLDGAGYELKEEEGSTKDLKENFQVTLRAYDRLNATAHEINYSEVFWFINDAHDVIELITPLVLEFADSVGQEFGLPKLIDEVEASRHNWFLRYIHYFGDRKAGDEIATPHADKSGFTLHLYESAPGLQYLELERTGNTEGIANGSRRWKEMPVSDGQTVIIPKVQLQYKSEGQLKALCHRVVATDTTAQTGRFSVVCFITFLQTPLFNTKGKGRQQDFAPGYNYDMNHVQFSQFFES